MKKTILKLLFIVICTFSITAQSQATFTGLKKDYTQSMDSIMTYVNKTPITTGILYDRVMSFSSLNMLKENAVITKSNYQNFIQSWSELYRSAYNPTFISLENLKTNIKANTNPNLVDIGIINTKMNYIDYGTPTNPSLTTTGGYLYNVAGINPFLEKQITLISPLKERVISGTVTFRLLSSFMLQLTGSQIKTLVANFGTTTNYNLINNYVISTTNPEVIFTTSGKKEFVFTVTFSNNITETLKATMDIVVSNNSTAKALASLLSFPLEQDFVEANGISLTSTGNVAFQGYNETSTSKGVLEYRTYYNLVTNNGSAVSKIKKPIIILDGYDPGDGRKIYQGSTGYDSSKSSLYELMAYDDDNNPATIPINLVEKLRSAPYGFDVTLVNFPNGADYVERNAMALVALLNRENEKLTANGSTEKVSIIGPSMGGLVSRYALAYMEKNGLNHNTKLWVSFDSPHLGANIPIGAQENLYFYGYKGRQDQAKIKFDENFRSPAARQMLIEQLDGKQEASPYPTDLWANTSPNGQNNNSPFRQQFQNNLNTNGLSGSNGYPQNLRKIALINGTTNGTTTNNTGNKFLELAAFTIIKFGQIFGTPIQTKIKVATIEDSFLQNTGGYGQTFAGKVTIKRVGGIEVQNGSISRTNSNPRGSMDNVQGGTFNTQGIIKDEFTLALNDAVDSQEWRQYLPNHAFIPSVSSLAFKNSNFDWSSAINRNLVCDPLNKEIYFDTYFAPSTNQEHVFVSAENADWLVKELQGISQAPYFPLQTNLLSGPSSICTNTTYVFSDVCKLPSAVTSWTVIPSTNLISSTLYSVTINGSANSEVTITATFQNGQTVSKTVWSGLPTYRKLLTYSNIPYDQFQLNGPYWNPTWDFSTNSPNDQVDEFIFKDLNDNLILTKYANNGLVTISASEIGITYGQTMSLYVYTKNACGTVNPIKKGIIKTTIYCPTLCEYGVGVGCNLARLSNSNNSFYKIYPNPSSNLINVDLKNQDQKPNQKSKIISELYNMMGEVKRNVSITNKIATIDVSGLPIGIYILKINIDDVIESHQVVIE
jgi:hypothetical protein